MTERLAGASRWAALEGRRIEVLPRSFFNSKARGIEREEMR